MSQIVCNDIGNFEVNEGKPFNRILIPYSDSAHASKVFGLALTVAKIFGASITMVSVTQKDPSRSWVNDTPGREKGMSLDYVDILKRGMIKLEQQAKKFGVRFEYVILTSKTVSETILSYITDKKIDLVIMGTRGKGMWKEMLLGRVSSTVGINAPCPVLLVK